MALYRPILYGGIGYIIAHIKYIMALPGAEP